jgi:lipopolysaccharide transport system ATP-binding protein
MTTVISVENLSKIYRLGQIGTGTFTNDLRVWWAKMRGRPNPLLKIGQADHGNLDGDELWALRDISFTVQQGEVLGIIGRNGAGKSTLLKILSRVTAPTSGKIKVKGRVASLLEVGTGFHPELTGRENIYLNGAILGMKYDEISRKFDEIVDFSEVEKFIDTPVKRYSSGMYVRLAFAVAAHLEPEILVVDEVLAVGDTEFQKKCLGKMGDVAKEGRTVLFVSHNITAIHSLCHKAIWLDTGQIAEAGEVGQVVSDYLQRGAISLMEQKWDDSRAPGNEKVQLQSVRLTPIGRDVSTQIDVETTLRLEFEFWNNLPNAVLNFSVVVYNIEGICIFNTGSTAEPFSKGLVYGSFIIPPHFMNDGVYNVRLLIVKDMSAVLLDVNDVLKFEVRDVERPGNWYGKWIGAVRPKFDWTIRAIGNG